MRALAGRLLPEFRVIYGSYWMAIAGLSICGILFFWAQYQWWSVLASLTFAGFGIDAAVIHLIQKRGEPLSIHDINMSMLNLVTQLHAIYANSVLLLSDTISDDLRNLFLCGALVSMSFMFAIWIARHTDPSRK